MLYVCASIVFPGVPFREKTTSYDNATSRRGLLGFWNRYHYIILYTIDIYIIYTHRDNKIYYINNLKSILYNIGAYNHEYSK